MFLEFRRTAPGRDDRLCCILLQRRAGALIICANGEVKKHGYIRDY